MRTLLFMMTPCEKRKAYSVVLVCDFQQFLVSRILDVYEFFQNPPHIILVRRGKRVSFDHRLSVHSQIVPLPVKGLEGKGLANAFSAACVAIGYLIYSLVLFLRISRAKIPIRLVHAHFTFPQGLFCLILARLSGVPLIVSAVGYDVNSFMRGNVLLRGLSRFVLMRAFVVIVVSKPLQIALGKFGVSNSVYLPNSVDTASIRPKGQVGPHLSILFIGSMTERKRPFVLLSACQRLLTRFPTITLCMVGNGPLRGALQEEIHQRRLDNNVKLLPQVSPSLLEDLLSKASVFVLPSVSEGLSLALLEAMAAGKAIVASANESHRAVLRHKENALLFKIDDDKDLADQIALVLTDDDLRLKLSQSARKLCVRDFSNTAVAASLEKIYLGATNCSSSTTTIRFSGSFRKRCNLTHEESARGVTNYSHGVSSFIVAVF